MTDKKIGCVQHDCPECKDRERQSVPAGLQNIDRSVIEQALAAFVRAEVMYGQPNFDIQDKLREALAQPARQELCKELAALGWQAIECPVCGSSAQGYPRQAAQPLTETQADALNTLCKMLHSVEEVEGDDGLAMLVPMDLWNEAQDAIKLLISEDDGTEAAHATTKGTT